jgi:hypothetical protein
MQGMDKKHDGHPLCVVKTTHIKNNYGLNFRRFTCVAEDCPSLLRGGKSNEVHWEGAIYNVFLPKHVLLPHSIIELADFVKHPFHVFLNVM